MVCLLSRPALPGTVSREPASLPTGTKAWVHSARSAKNSCIHSFIHSLAHSQRVITRLLCAWLSPSRGVLNTPEEYPTVMSVSRRHGEQLGTRPVRAGSRVGRSTSSRGSELCAWRTGRERGGLAGRGHRGTRGLRRKTIAWCRSAPSGKPPRGGDWEVARSPLDWWRGVQAERGRLALGCTEELVSSGLRPR